MSAVEAPMAAAEPTPAPIVPDPFETFPLVGLMFAFDTQWRAFRNAHRRNDDVAALHELFRPMAAEIHRLGLVEQFTGRLAFQGDARAAFERCVELARGAGLPWPEIVAAVNNAGEAGR